MPSVFPKSGLSYTPSLPSLFRRSSYQRKYLPGDLGSCVDLCGLGGQHCQGGALWALWERHPWRGALSVFFPLTLRLQFFQICMIVYSLPCDFVFWFQSCLLPCLVLGFCPIVSSSFTPVHISPLISFSIYTIIFLGYIVKYCFSVCCLSCTKLFCFVSRFFLVFDPVFISLFCNIRLYLVLPSL